MDAASFKLKAYVSLLASSASRSSVDMCMLWLILSLWACGVHAARFEKNSNFQKDIPSKLVDCSGLKPPPKWLKVTTELKGREGEDSHHFYYVTNVPVNECEDYFVHISSGFAAMQKIQAGDDLFCAAASFQGSGNYCKDQKLDVLVNYSKEWVPELCKDRLCRYAKTGDWRDDEQWKSYQFSVRRSYRKWVARKKPWKRRTLSSKSEGFEDVYEACWKGPRDTYKLPSLEVLDEKYHLISPAGTFNKKVCGCPTADKC